MPYPHVKKIILIKTRYFHSFSYSLLLTHARPEHLMYDIYTSDTFSDRMFYLKPCIHLQEVKVLLRVHQKLDSTWKHTQVIIYNSIFYIKKQANKQIYKHKTTLPTTNYKLCWCDFEIIQPIYKLFEVHKVLKLFYIPLYDNPFIFDILTFSNFILLSFVYNVCYQLWAELYLSWNKSHVLFCSV